MKTNGKIILIGVFCFFVGIIMGSFLTTRIAFVYEFSGRSELLLALRQMIKENMQEKAIHVIDNQIDSHIHLFEDMKNPFTYGLFFMNPSNILHTYSNQKASAFDVKEYYKNQQMEFSPKSQKYLESVQSRF